MSSCHAPSRSRKAASASTTDPTEEGADLTDGQRVAFTLADRWAGVVPSAMLAAMQRCLIVALVGEGARPEELLRVDTGPRLVAAHGTGWQLLFRPLEVGISLFVDSLPECAEQIRGASKLGRHVVLAVDSEGAWRCAAMAMVDIGRPTGDA